MKKVQKLLISTLCVVLGASALVACGGDSNDGKNGNEFTVTFYDATGTTKPNEMTVLKTVKVQKDGTVESFDPDEKTGYEFMGWYGTPTKSQPFDFTAEITQDTAIFGGFSKYVEDTREYYIVGSGTSELLFTSNWGKNIIADHKLTKAADKNEYTITCDLKQGDEFQFALNADWANKRGYGYMASLKLDDGTVAFSGQGSVFDDSAKGSNIKCEHSGNYTLTLKTYPNDDYYNTSGNGYSEDRKEIYNVGTYDKIEFKRNGDVINNTVTITDYYINGASITKWGDMYNEHTQMTRNGSEYTMSVYLKAGDEFIFTTRVTKIEDDETSYAKGSKFIKSNLLDAEGQKLLDGYTLEHGGANMKAKATGTYTFKYDATADKLVVTFDATVVPEALDYYIDGTAVGEWNVYDNTRKLVETETGSGIYKLTTELAADKEFEIRACKAGETATATNTAANQYQYDCLVAGDAFEQMSATNKNIKVKTAGTYDITFDSYSKIITVVKHVDVDPADTLDIYVKGVNFTNGAGTAGTWNPNFAAEWRMTLGADKTTYEITLNLTATSDLGFAKFDKGATSGYGEFLGATALGTDGGANSVVKPESGNNLKCSTEGTYRFVYTIATGKLDVYAVAQE